MIPRVSVEAADHNDHTLEELTATFEMKEMFVERLEHHIGAAMSDAVFDMLGEQPLAYDVTIPSLRLVHT